ncbi:MAG: hypothetical protein HY558_02645, partial [Euryarchaeota archaeon]|nr:hypothetical protein [Euryarchaeota archaeon]
MERSRAGGARVSTVLLPSSFTSETRDPRQRVYRAGVVARALAIFRVEQVVIYRDPYGPDDAHAITTLLEYAETPQYLRRRLFPLREELRDAGLLPALRTPHHPVEARVRRLQVGEVR